ncbi:MAG: DUF3572 family protein [Rhodobacteraceae bacterium]|nr:DUF3572 family protein [Paracoccaceae bacterium]
MAETVALAALGWLAAQDDLWPVFLGATGADAAAVRAGAGDPEFLAAVLDFILMDDAWVIAAAAAQEVAPERLAQARAALPGGAAVHWT